MATTETARFSVYLGMAARVLLASTLILLGIALCSFPIDPATATLSDHFSALAGLLMVSAGCGLAMFSHTTALKTGGKFAREFLALVLCVAAAMGALLVIANLISASKDAPQVPHTAQIPAHGFWLALATIECAASLVWMMRAAKKTNAKS